MARAMFEYTKNVANKKAHFKAVSAELEAKATELVAKVNSL